MYVTSEWAIFHGSVCKWVKYSRRGFRSLQSSQNDAPFCLSYPFGGLTVSIHSKLYIPSTIKTMLWNKKWVLWAPIFDLKKYTLRPKLTISHFYVHQLFRAYPIKVIIHKSRSQQTLWHRYWDLGWFWVGWQYWKKNVGPIMSNFWGCFFHVFRGNFFYIYCSVPNKKLHNMFIKCIMFIKNPDLDS